MPKKVDHESRRRALADAVCALAAERGAEAVTLRDVAARAGMSMGAVQRTFETRDDMLVFALGHVGERVLGRVREELARSPRRAERSRLVALASGLALLDEARRDEAAVWLAFVAQAAFTPRLAKVLRASYGEVVAALAALLGGDSEDARSLLALVDGLTLHVLVGQLTPKAAKRILDMHILRLSRRDA